jgi:hypothetical protein
MITRIEPPIPLTTPKGKGMAHFLIDYGMENDLMWIVFQDDTGECWTWENAQIRARINQTIGRMKVSSIEL